MDDSNPYAPPETEDIFPEEEKHPWFTAVRSVFMKHGAELPEIDLEGGTAGEHLVRSTRTVAKSKPAASVAVIGVMAVTAFFASEYIDDWPLFLIVILLASYGLRILFRLITPHVWLRQVRFTIYMTRGTEQFRKRLIAAHWILSLLIFIPAFFVPEDIRIPALLGGVVGLRLIAWRLDAFALKRHPIQVRFSEGHGDWVRISGVHRDALAKLREIETERDS